jgi:archaeosine-15-forming tRNA-guanine transglycosylase
MRDNTFQAQKSIGATTQFGERADNVLIKTQGKSFIKAKNKFKNVYRGGELDCVVRSHKFV